MSETTTAAKAGPARPKQLDDYFPLINQGIMFLILTLAVVLVSGVDVIQLAQRVFNPDRDGSPVVVADAGERLASGFQLSSLSVWGPGGWKVVVGLVIVMLALAGVALAVLSANGRDAEWTKEQKKAIKAKETPKVQPVAQTTAAADEDEECNLASYKLLFGNKQKEAAANTETAAAGS